MVAQMVGCVHPVASPVVVERGDMTLALSSFPAQLVKVQFMAKEVTHSGLNISFKQGA